MRYQPRNKRVKVNKYKKLERTRAARVNCSKANLNYRIYFLLALFMFLATGVFSRLYYLQIHQGQKWLRLASKQHQCEVEIKGARGSILDRNARALAVSVKSTSVAAHPRRIKDPVAFADELAPFLNLAPSEIVKKIDNNKSFVWLEKGLPSTHMAKLRQLNLTSLSVFPEFRRFYPNGKLASSLVGWLGRDGSGLSGMESAYDEILKAPSKQLAMRRDARGRLVPVSVWEKASEPELRNTSYIAEGKRDEGSSLVLSIDTLMQDILEEELELGRLNAEARKVFGLMLDAETGEVLAAAQTSQFDPNSKKSFKPEDLRNSILQDNFEPGSTFKPLIMAAALDRRAVQMGEVMDCKENGRYRVGPHTIRDAHPVGEVDLSEVIVKSSNICMAKIAERLGKEEVHQIISEFNFGKRTGVEIKGEAKGIFRSLKNWKKVDLATHSFGQGIAVTALQMVQAYSALANGGLMSSPTFLKRSENSELHVKRVLSPEAVNDANQMLLGVVENEGGTGRNAAISGIKVYGKTGTAQKAKADGRGYEEDKVISSFIGFADATEVGFDKKIVMLVVVDEPGVSPRWGGTVAAPVFKRVMEQVILHSISADENGFRTASLGDVEKSILNG